MAIASSPSPQPNGKRSVPVGTVWVGDGPALLNQARQWLVDRGEGDRAQDYAVITPSPQAARALAVPPRSLEKWGRLKIQPWTTAPIIVTHRLLRAAVVKYWQTTDPAATVQRILPTLRQYFRAGLDLIALRDCDGVSTRSRQIAQIAIAYQAQLRSRRLIDEGELFTVALANARSMGDRDPGAPMLIHGYGWPGSDEAEFMAAIAPQGSAIGLDPAATEAIAIFRQAGWAIEDLPATETFKTEPQAYAFANGAAEVRWALGQVKQWLLDGVPPKEIALVARDERTYGEWLADVAWDYETPVRLLFSLPLASTRVGGWVQDLLEAATSNYPFETTAKLLRHPLCGYGIVVDPSLIDDANDDANNEAGDGGESPALNGKNGDRPDPANPIAVGEDWWHLARKRHPEGLNAWAAIGIDLKTWLKPTATKQSRGEWVGWLNRVIAKGKLRRRAGSWARETAAIATLLRQLGDLNRFQDLRSPDSVLSDNSLPDHGAPADPAFPDKTPPDLLTLSQFAEEMRDVLSLATVPAEPGRAGVALHQPRALVGSAYDHVIVLGAMEGTLPEPIVNDPVVDFYERKRLTRAGFPLDSAATLARREWHHFQSIRTAGRSLTLTYPKLVGKDEQLPSPFLDRLDIGQAIAPGPAQPPANWSEAYRAYLHHRDRLTADFADPHCQSLDRIYQSWTVEKGRESVGPADEYDGVIGIDGKINPRDHVFSASQITALGQCSFKWFVARLLRSRELPEADDGLSAAKAGTFYHRVLEILLDEWRLDSADACAQKLENAVDQAAEEMFLGTILTWLPQRREVINILHRAIASDWFMPEGTEFIKGESKFDGEWHDLRVTGQLDRIDRRPTTDGENGLVIIDYKTGKSFPKGAKNHDGKANLDVQLSLYKTVAPRDPKLKELPGGEEISDAFYFSIKKGDRLDPTKKDAANQDSQLVHLAARVKENLTTGTYTVHPDRDRHACRYCDAKLACRQGDRLARKTSFYNAEDSSDSEAQPQGSAD